MILKLIGFFVYSVLVLNGVSLWIRQKDFDVIAYLFYPESYEKNWWFDLSNAPYWLSFFLGTVYIFGPIWLYIYQKEKGKI